MKLSKKTIGLTAAFALTFAIGAGVGSSGGNTAETSAAPVKTKTVVQTKTPQACLDALDSGDTLIQSGASALRIAGNSLGEVPKLINAITSLDTTELQNINDRMEKNNKKLESIPVAEQRADWDANKEACRSASGKHA